MNVAVVSFSNYHGRPKGTIGSSVLRADWLVDAWPEAFSWTNGAYADALILQKAYWKDMVEDFPGPVILDLCDPDWMSGKNKPDLEIKWFADHVGHITCSTEKLTAFVRQLTKTPVTYIPDRVNLQNLPKPRTHDGKATTVTWFGYSHNAEEVLDAVLPSLQRHGLKLRVISNNPYEPVNHWNVDIENVHWSPETCWYDIRAGDLAINPPSIRSNFRYKSNNKTLISWALGLPVASTIEDMERFLDPVERQKEAARRMAEIQKDWVIERSVEQYKAIIHALHGNAA